VFLGHSERVLAERAGLRETRRVPAFTPPEVRPLISAERIAARVNELAAQITRDYTGRSVVLLSVLKGSFVFAADLARAIDLPIRMEFLGVRSYGADTKSSGVVQITQDLTRPVTGDDLVIVEDIIDTGLTISYLKEQLRGRNPASVKVAALLHKPARIQREVEIDYLGFTIDDVFVVGYGLDYAERYRNLPYLGVLDPSQTGAK
jgi:hypoxanthine phosphoribosyltransferase